MSIPRLKRLKRVKRLKRKTGSFGGHPAPDALLTCCRRENFVRSETRTGSDRQPGNNPGGRKDHNTRPYVGPGSPKFPTHNTTLPDHGRRGRGAGNRFCQQFVNFPNSRRTAGGPVSDRRIADITGHPDARADLGCSWRAIWERVHRLDQLCRKLPGAPTIAQFWETAA